MRWPDKDDRLLLFFVVVVVLSALTGMWLALDQAMTL